MSKRRTPTTDPHAGREAELYEQPIASREFIMEQLRASGGPMDFRELVTVLGIKGHQPRDALRRRLGAMNRDGQVLVNRQGNYALVEKMALEKGRISLHRDGYAFVLRDDGGEDVFIAARHARRYMDGDRVLLRISHHDGGIEGRVVEVLERSAEPVVGRFVEEGGVAFVEPEGKRMNQDIVIPADGRGRARHGDFVSVRLTAEPDAHRVPTGKVLEVLGAGDEVGVEREVVIRAHGIPREFGRDVLREAEALPATVTKADMKGRVDLRDLPLVTIDGADARDFDDAVYCDKRRGGGWRLFVAIADVSHYVQPDSALDASARERGNSVYFPDCVIPMLPEALSNELCSLKPDVPRLCMVCEMTVSKRGRVTGFKFCEAVMHSHARLTYDQVGSILGVRKDDTAAERRELGRQYADLVPHLEELHLLYQAFRSQRQARGALDFDRPETKIVLDDRQQVEAIVGVTRHDAHKLIEECMIAANVCAARFLEQTGVPGLYRVHEGVLPRKLEELRELLAGLALDLPKGNQLEPGAFRELLAGAAERPDQAVIETLILRSMTQAVYSETNGGHFGLALDAYSHFTSPIRRYADLLVHRAIRSVIRSRIDTELVQRVRGAPRLPKHLIYPYDQAALADISAHVSITDRRADEAVWDLEAWLKCRYMEQHLGDTFGAVVASVTSFGLFCELDELHIQGLAHISTLGKDYFEYDQSAMVLTGGSTGQVFGIGDRVKVQVARVDPAERKIDLAVVPEPGSAGAGARKGAGGKSRGGRRSGGGAKAGGRAGGKSAGKSAGKKASGKAADKSGGKPASKSASKSAGGKAATAGKSSTAANKRKALGKALVKKAGQSGADAGGSSSGGRRRR